MKRISPIAILGLCAALFQTSAHAQEIKPGLWEIATTMKMQGMEMPGGKFTHCYTAQDVAAGKQYKSEDGKCTISNMKTGGGNVSYDMNCNVDGGGKLTGAVKGTMSPTAYTFEQKMRMTPDQGMGEMHSTIKGRRLGDCK